MKKKHPDYKVVPFPKVRLRITDFLRLQHRKHAVHALIEADVTKPRKYIREHNVNSLLPKLHFLASRYLNVVFAMSKEDQ